MRIILLLTSEAPLLGLAKSIYYYLLISECSSQQRGRSVLMAYIILLMSSSVQNLALRHVINLRYSSFDPRYAA